MAGEETWKATLEVLGASIRAERVTAGLSLRDLAERAKVSNAYLSQIERGLHEPSISVLGAIARALDVSLEALLARAGVLDAGEGRALVHDTEAAIIADPELSEAQRIALLSVYRSFVPARRPAGDRSARSPS
ncbi:MAG TPA: helix-turn-helix transcriptional regulator [Solirubrobacteraceae bacterium]|nr:helix-turn-helix transcriptional regulator [Solirubrobacteraceae bacterium]